MNSGNQHVLARELWMKFREGNTDAFGRLTKIYYRDLFNYGSHFTTDRELLKDCIQDVFLSLWKNRESISDTDFVKYYLIKSLRRKLKRAMERNRRYLNHEDILFHAEFENEIPIETKMIIDEEMKIMAGKIRQILAQLTKRQQEVIYLRFYTEAEISDISQIMQLSRQSVYNLLHDALNRLRIFGKDQLFRSVMFLLI